MILPLLGKCRLLLLELEEQEMIWLLFRGYAKLLMAAVIFSWSLIFYSTTAEVLLWMIDELFAEAVAAWLLLLLFLCTLRIIDCKIGFAKLYLANAAELFIIGLLILTAVALLWLLLLLLSLSAFPDYLPLAATPAPAAGTTTN